MTHAQVAFAALMVEVFNDSSIPEWKAHATLDAFADLLGLNDSDIAECVDFLGRFTVKALNDLAHV